MATIFEQLISGELPCARVYEDELVFAFMDAGQVNPGHVLVASRKAYATLMDADEATAMAMMRVAQQIAQAVQEIFQPEGITILQANREAGWQTVPHLHLHVLPRYFADGVDLVWPRKEPGMEVLHTYARQLGESRTLLALYASLSRR